MSFEHTELRFDCEDPSLLHQRLRISRFIPSSGEHDIENAICPTAPRRLTPDEWNAVRQNMVATPDTPDGAVIELISDQRFMKVSRLHIQGIGDVAVKAALDGLMPAESKFVAIVHTDRDVSSTCKVDLKIPQFTQGMDKLQGKIVGSHVDNLFYRPCESRIDSPRRIGINLGPGARWLLIGVPDILTIAQDRGLQASDIPRTKHFADYVLDRPYDPVACLWLRQLPGEAYILPTELAVHDGSTVGERAESAMAFYTWHSPVGVFPSALRSPSAESQRLEKKLIDALSAYPYKGNPSIFTLLH